MKLFNQPSKSGNDIIADAIGSFTKVQDDLTKGMELCKSDNEKISTEISKLEEAKEKNSSNIQKANKVFENISKMLEG